MCQALGKQDRQALGGPTVCQVLGKQGRQALGGPTVCQALGKQGRQALGGPTVCQVLGKQDRQALGGPTVCQALGKQGRQALDPCAPGGTDPTCEPSEEAGRHAVGSRGEEQTPLDSTSPSRCQAGGHRAHPRGASKEKTGQSTRVGYEEESDAGQKTRHHRESPRRERHQGLRRPLKGGWCHLGWGRHFRARSGVKLVPGAGGGGAGGSCPAGLGCRCGVWAAGDTSGAYAWEWRPRRPHLH